MPSFELPPNAIPIWEFYPPASHPDDDFTPYIEPFLATGDRPRGAVLVCPGGGYANRAPHEAAPIAEKFQAAGFHAFVVQYRVAPHRHPAPLKDLSRALRIVRDRASEWNVLPDHIAVLGFSAGGHLAASLGVHYDLGRPNADDTLDRLSCRPDAMLLCYPVITSGPYYHGGSFQNLLGPNASPQLMTKMSLERQVTEQTPPAFLWHTVDDGSVPVENSLLFAAALRKQGVPFELHVFPHGRHGLGLSPEDPHIAHWMHLAIEWLAGMGW